MLIDPQTPWGVGSRSLDPLEPTPNRTLGLKLNTNGSSHFPQNNIPPPSTLQKKKLANLANITTPTTPNLPKKAWVVFFSQRLTPPKPLKKHHFHACLSPFSRKVSDRASNILGSAQWLSWP